VNAGLAPHDPADGRLNIQQAARHHQAAAAGKDDNEQDCQGDKAAQTSPTRASEVAHHPVDEESHPFKYPAHPKNKWGEYRRADHPANANEQKGEKKFLRHEG